MLRQPTMQYCGLFFFENICFNCLEIKLILENCNKDLPYNSDKTMIWLKKDYPKKAKRNGSIALHLFQD